MSAPPRRILRRSSRSLAGDGDPIAGRAGFGFAARADAGAVPARPTTGRPGRRPSSLRFSAKCTLPVARRGVTRLIVDQITAAANRAKPVDSELGAVCEALPHDRVALLLRGTAATHSPNADRANLRAASLPNLVRDDPGLVGLLSKAGATDTTAITTAASMSRYAFPWRMASPSTPASGHECCVL
jgi:hypothetical protein